MPRGILNTLRTQVCTSTHAVAVRWRYSSARERKTCTGVSALLVSGARESGSIKTSSPDAASSTSCIAALSYVWPAVFMTGSLKIECVMGHSNSSGVSKTRSTWLACLCGVTGAAMALGMNKARVVSCVALVKPRQHNARKTQFVSHLFYTTHGHYCPHQCQVQSRHNRMATSGLVPTNLLAHATLWIFGGFALKTSGLLSENDGKVRLGDDCYLGAMLRIVLTYEGGISDRWHSQRVLHLLSWITLPALWLTAFTRYEVWVVVWMDHAQPATPDMVSTIHVRTCLHTPTLTHSIATDLEGFAILAAVAVTASGISALLAWYACCCVWVHHTHGCTVFAGSVGAPLFICTTMHSLTISMHHCSYAPPCIPSQYPCTIVHMHHHAFPHNIHAPLFICTTMHSPHNIHAMPPQPHAGFCFPANHHKSVHFSQAVVLGGIWVMLQHL